MDNYLATSNLLIVGILKMCSISYQTYASVRMFHIYNLAISLLKIGLLPILFSLDTLLISGIFILLLSTSPYLYCSNILSMIVLNSLFVKILSNKRESKDLPYYGFFGKVGGIIGILCIPTLLIIYNFLGNVITKYILSTLLVFIFCKTLMPYINILRTNKRESKLSIRNLLRNSYKYKDVILVYIIASMGSFLISNISFFTSSSRHALMPCLAYLVLSFKGNKRKELIIPLFTLIGFSISSIFFNAGIFFLVSLVLAWLITGVKEYAENKYGDALIPHLSAHLIGDILWSIIHMICVIYYTFIIV